MAQKTSVRTVELIDITESQPTPTKRIDWTGVCINAIRRFSPAPSRISKYLCEVKFRPQYA